MACDVEDYIEQISRVSEADDDGETRSSFAGT